MVNTRNISSTLRSDLRVHGGPFASLLPLLFFVTGAIYLGLNSCPDERGYWPILIVGLVMALLLSRDRRGFAGVVIEGMSNPLVMIMVSAWLLAGVIGIFMQAAGLVESIAGLAQGLNLTGRWYVLISFLISMATGTFIGSGLGTILMVAPVLFPAGAALGANPYALLGAIISGGSFGDNISPISDTTIAAASTQRVPIIPTVTTRLQYALPAALGASFLFLLFGNSDQAGTVAAVPFDSSLSMLPMLMLLVPAVVIYACVLRRELVEALLWGILAAMVVSLSSGLLTVRDLFRLNTDSNRAEGLILDGLNRGVGVSIFTLLLMGLVSFVISAGVMPRLIDWFSSAMNRVSRTTPGRTRLVETCFVLLTLAANSVLSNNAVTIVSIGEVVRRLGRRFGISGVRTANILDVTSSTITSIFPYMIPVIVAAGVASPFLSMYELDGLSTLRIGLHVFHSWMLLIVIFVAVLSGYGSRWEGHEDRKIS